MHNAARLFCAVPMLLLAVLLATGAAAASVAPSRTSPLYGPNYLGPSPDWTTPQMLQHGIFLVRSYRALTGKDLVAGGNSDDEAARRLFLLHDRVVVSHGTQKDLPDGPVLNYGNIAALRRWGASWEQLTSMPSKFTAGPMERSVREAFMKQVTENGIVNNYSGIRVALDGTQFAIKDATVWNVEIDGLYLGQAATYPLSE